jgi:hypothetical protein
VLEKQCHLPDKATSSGSLARWSRKTASLAVAFAALEKEPLLANRLQRYEDVEKNMFPLLLSAKFQTGKMMCVFF